LVVFTLVFPFQASGLVNKFGLRLQLWAGGAEILYFGFLELVFLSSFAMPRIALFLAVVLCLQVCFADISITPGGQSVQGAVDNVNAGESVLMAAGVYTQANIILPTNKNFRLQGVPSATVLDCGNGMPRVSSTFLLSSSTLLK